MKQEYLLDSNVLIYLGHGNKKIARQLLRLKRPYFFSSVITYFEILYGCKTLEEKKLVKQYANDLAILDLRKEIIEAALELKEKKKLKFKDLLIAATAQMEGLTLVTADKDFKKIKGLKVKLLNL
ncbi:PIN domain-containing protein [Candidatus Peregrinibacteria bacterium]|nr:MAG: PIN domain-containing protein [Candidatus Peregrinibacteria bacterium]